MSFTIENLFLMEIMKYMDCFSNIAHCWKLTKGEICRSVAEILHCMERYTYIFKLSLCSRGIQAIYSTVKQFSREQLVLGTHLL